MFCPGGSGEVVGRRVVAVRAVVVGRVGVVDDGADPVGVRRHDGIAVGRRLVRHRRHRAEPVGLTRDQVQRAGGRGTEDAVEGVVRHGELLGVVPDPGDGVAVVVVHAQPRCAEDDRLTSAGVGAGVLDELVHLPVVECQLLGQVAVVLVARERLAGREPGGVVLVRVAHQQARALEVVVLGRARRRDELGAVGVLGRRIGGEVVVVGNVLVEDHDEMLDGACGLVGTVGNVLRSCRREDGVGTDESHGRNGGDAGGGADTSSFSPDLHWWLSLSTAKVGAGAGFRHCAQGRGPRFEPLSNQWSGCGPTR